MNLLRRTPSVTIKVATQNLTEGPIPSAIRGVDVFLGQEVNAGRLRAGFGDDHRSWIPNKDNHQAIVWDTETFASHEQGKSFKFHGSGAGDPDVPDGIATPARWLHEKRLNVRRLDLECVFMTTWLINSWNPMGGHDQWTEKRREMAQKSLKIIAERVDQHTDAGRLVFIGGDFNSIRAHIDFNRLKSPTARGLDRMFYPRDRAVKFKGLKHGPKTGVGGDMQHSSLIATYKLTAAK